MILIGQKICQLKIILCMYKMNTFAVFTAESWGKNDFEVTEYSGEIWINQKHLGRKLDIANC